MVMIISLGVSAAVGGQTGERVTRQIPGISVSSGVGISSEPKSMRSWYTEVSSESMGGGV